VNDEDAKLCWRVFFKHRSQLARYVRNLGPSEQDTVDILQEVALRLLRQPRAPAPPQALPAWCKAVARRIVLHELRAARYERHKLAALSMCVSPESRQRDAGAMTRMIVRQWLAAVSDQEREMLLRRYLLEENSWEIAEAMMLSPAAVRMRLMRLRRHLQPAPVEAPKSRPRAHSEPSL